MPINRGEWLNFRIENLKPWLASTSDLFFSYKNTDKQPFKKQVIVSLHNREYGLIRTNFPVAGADPTIHIYLQHGVATVVPTFPKQN